ncbi:MAG TPA: phytanoyl-CoA dioxygenase family protein [Armatimonadota bacterium]|nr:phytanoyl-CoA dioxygenase family protein [Armatimonadota bacterium]
MGRSPMIDAEQREQFVRDGFVVVRGLIPGDLAAATAERLLQALEVDPADPATWNGKAVTADLAVIALTEPCRTDAVERAAEALVGSGFVPGLAFSPYLDSRGVQPNVIRGYIPVLRFPEPGPPVFERPTGFHIDGMHATTLWPDKHFLVVFAYLTDTAAHGGATAVLPGSHRQVFEHWVRAGHPGSTVPPDLEYAEPVAVPGGVGDVIFMHYLTVHSGTTNRSDRIRVGLNTAVLPHPERPYRRKKGPPGPDWTPLDRTLRTDNL